MSCGAAHALAQPLWAASPALARHARTLVGSSPPHPDTKAGAAAGDGSLGARPHAGSLAQQVDWIAAAPYRLLLPADAVPGRGQLAWHAPFNSFPGGAPRAPQ